MTCEPRELFDFLQSAPTWLQDRRIDELHLTLRVRNALKNGRIRRVGDLVAIEPAKLQCLRNFGPRALNELLEALRLATSRSSASSAGKTQEPAADDRGPEHAVLAEQSSDPVAAVSAAVSEEPLERQLAASLRELDPLDVQVLMARLGHDGVAERLDAVGRRLGVTRERARQRESRALRRLRDFASWPSALEPRLIRLFAHRTEPLFLDLISAEDPWFVGFEDRLFFLGKLVEEFTQQRVHLWALKGRYVLARIDEAAWHKLLAASTVALRTHTDTSLSKAEVKLFLESMALKAGAPELSAELFDALEHRIHFATTESGAGEVLVAVGRGLTQALRAILQEARRPLRLREIQRKLLQRGETRVDANNVRNALRSVGALLFRRSTYGLPAHFAYGSDECRLLVAEIERIVHQGPPDRQWHCSQLIRELRRRRVRLPKDFDPYAVNIALTLYSRLRNLRRLVWSAEPKRASLAKERREIADLCGGALREAGRPLSKRELRKAIERVRGLNTTFLPQPNDQMARLGRGLWGLIDRDFGLSEAERERILAALVRRLSERHASTHVSAIEALLSASGLRLPPGVTNEMVAGLCQADRRFRVGRSGIIGLRKSNRVARNR